MEYYNFEFMNYFVKVKYVNYINLYNVCNFVAAVVVRYLTKRYIGEYSSTGGEFKILDFFNLCIKNFYCVMEFVYITRFTSLHTYFTRDFFICKRKPFPSDLKPYFR